MIDPSAPLQVARTFVRARARALRFWDGEFWDDGKRLELDALRAELYRWLADQRGPRGAAVKPNKGLVNNVVDALKAATWAERRPGRGAGDG